MAISMLKIRRPLGRLIFNMGIAIPGKTVFLIETAPRCKHVSMNIAGITLHCLQVSSAILTIFAQITNRQTSSAQLNLGIIDWNDYKTCRH